MNPRDFHKPCPGDQCLLCGARPVAIGAFVPERPEDFGGIPGKSRIFRYYLCSSCQGKPDAQDRIEKVIRAEVAGGVAHAS